jgi:DmsE family decaheme c-type cytochrome
MNRIKTMRNAMKMALFSALLMVAGTLSGAARAGDTLPAITANLSAAGPVAAGGGAQTCLKCHNTNQTVVQILQTPHGVTGDANSPMGQQGCESCHGPSAAHVASRKNEPDVVFKGANISSPAKINQQCLTCHQSGLRMNWQGSQHQSNDLACVSCHTVHNAKDPVLVRKTQPEKCFTCHKEQKSDSFKYSHHPIREGEVVCSDCHNPHGSAGPKLLKELTVNEVCYTCHAEKRGPLLWEHEPVREDCMNCHTPHGSVQARLLKERSPFLCQECHANGGHQEQVLAGQNLAGQVAASVRMMGRGCVNCHSQIHGSNSPNGTFFTR